MVDETFEGWYNPASRPYAWLYAPLHSVVLVVSDHVQNLPFWELMQKVLVVHLIESHLLYFTVLFQDSTTHHPWLHTPFSTALCLQLFANIVMLQ